MWIFGVCLVQSQWILKIKRVEREEKNVVEKKVESKIYTNLFVVEIN